MVNNWDLKEQNGNKKKLDFRGGFFAVLETCYVEKCETSKQHMNFNWYGKKKFDLNISICYVQEKNPFSFYYQIYLFETFIGISPQSLPFFDVPIQMHFRQKYFMYFYIC